MKKLISLTLLLSLTFVGCGGSGIYSAPSTVHAANPTVPDVGPDSFFCGASADGDGEVCSFVQHVKDAQGNVMFYCQGETHVFPVTKTMSYHLEIGVSTLISDPNLSGCNVPMPIRTGLLNMRGTLALVPWTGNLTSIATWVYAMDSGHKAVLYPGKIEATKGISTAVTMEGDSGQPLVFAQTHYIDSFQIWFNIDLPNSVPATISVSGAGDIE